MSHVKREIILAKLEGLEERNRDRALHRREIRAGHLNRKRCGVVREYIRGTLAERELYKKRA